jgi:DNA modification methylase/DNA-directed RNA polymerase subunit RPC12/RpoP
MEERKLTKEDIDRVRDIEGFPIAKDEDIIALSRPPYYTACPNPFIEDFIREHGTPYNEETDDYHREPFASDVSEGKNDPIYMAHTYHTKVPYKAIMRYILHYTNPGDIVLDGFCGTGMTGVAAQMCATPDYAYKQQVESEMERVIWGKRYAILNDLSPAATFISYNYNIREAVSSFIEDAEHAISKCREKYAWMFETQHTTNGVIHTGIDGKPIIGTINYIVWSDVLICPNCSKEITFWEVALDDESGKVRDIFKCQYCGSELSKRDCSRKQETYFDTEINRIITVAKQIPVSINYSVGNRRYVKAPDSLDLDIIRRINETKVPFNVPTDELPNGFNTEQPKRSHGLNHVHQFYTKRNLFISSCFFEHAKHSPLLRFVFTASNINFSKLYRYRANGKGGNVSGTLYIPSTPQENNAIQVIERKINDIKCLATVQCEPSSIIGCGSTTDISNIPNACIDYIFTDPPFGGNLNYSELSFLWEAWLNVVTNTQQEAIMNNVQGKSLADYQRLMEQCFAEYYRVLKPGRWMTVEFHNSQNAIWNAIAEAMLRAGFIVADVRTLDKKQGSFKQVTTTTAVKQDLVISAYKPKESFIRQFSERAGDPEMAWEFVRQHLQNVPIAPDSSGEIEVVSERQDYLLFDRMVAFHIMNGIPVPVDAHTFYAGLRERFIQRDGMFFLPDQVNEYDERRQKMELQDQQLSLFITDEKSAIIWLNAQLGKERQSYSEIQPKFLQDWHRNKFEQMPELLDMLKENFLQDEDGKWYVPDLSDKADLEKLRRKRLLKDFYDIYAKGTGRIKNARTEAIRVGFDECWKERNYSLIVKVGDRLPETVLQEDPALLMYYDNAANRM